MRIYCDGATDRCCYIIDGQEPVIFAYPERVTNNQGEYKAVILALEEAQNRQLEEVEILTDSQLVVCQVSGEYKCRKAHLLSLRDKVRELAQDLQATIKWIERENNPAGKLLG